MKLVGAELELTRHMSLRTKAWEIVLELTRFIAPWICTLDEFTLAVFLVYITASLINSQRLYIRVRVEKQLYVHVILPHLVSAPSVLTIQGSFSRKVLNRVVGNGLGGLDIWRVTITD